MKETYQQLAVDFKETKSHKAFAKLYNKMRPGLRSFISGFTKDYDVTEDLVARTFEKIYRKIDLYDPAYAITTWSYSIARRECLRWIKRERNKKISLSYINENGGEAYDDGTESLSISLGGNLSYEDDFITESEKWSEENEITAKYDLVVKAINELKPMYKDILVDNLFNGLKYKEIAFKMDSRLNELHLKYEVMAEEELEEYKKSNPKEYKEYQSLYKTTLQRVKNRVRRGKMIVESAVNQITS
jgi:RNA polymerase sigma-70 factor (ECF subfamily)